VAAARQSHGRDPDESAGRSTGATELSDDVGILVIGMLFAVFSIDDNLRPRSPRATILGWAS
jgi:hypothetical protein